MYNPTGGGWAAQTSVSSEPATRRALRVQFTAVMPESHYQSTAQAQAAALTNGGAALATLAAKISSAASALSLTLNITVTGAEGASVSMSGTTSGADHVAVMGLTAVVAILFALKY